MRKYIFVLLCITPLISLAQSEDTTLIKTTKNYAISGLYQNGYVFPTNDFVRGANAEKELINAFQTFSIRFSKQSFGQNLWEQIYNYPHWGIGLSVYDFYNPEEIGNPIALYGFFSAPFKRWDRLTCNYEIGFGTTFNWRHFDPITNSSNIAIGAGESFYIDAGLNLQYELTEHFDIETGFSLTHFSNGALKKPNFGLNTIAPKINIKYNFDERHDFIQQKIPEFHPEKEWLVSTFIGGTNVIFDSVNVDIQEKYEGITFPVAGITTTFNWHLWRKSKIGIGMAFTYNGSVNAQVAVDNNELEVTDGLFSDKIQISIFPSYEFVVNRFSLILQPAFYLYRKKLLNQTPVFHQRIGLKYHFTKDFFVGITLRDYAFHVSDFVEWNVGYRIKWK
ncbi:MAG: acyloxyacyl hydrolase [Proteiniphilum sp.]|nr:acyloxyacyl hydrolase [Proteiniphilum sp.]